MMDVALLDGGGQVEAGEKCGVLVAPIARKSESHNRKFVLKKKVLAVSWFYELNDS